MSITFQRRAGQWGARRGVKFRILVEASNRVTWGPSAAWFQRSLPARASRRDRVEQRWLREYGFCPEYYADDLWCLLGFMRLIGLV